MELEDIMKTDLKSNLGIAEIRPISSNQNSRRATSQRLISSVHQGPPALAPTARIRNALHSWKMYNQFGLTRKKRMH